MEIIFNMVALVEITATQIPMMKILMKILCMNVCPLLFVKSERAKKIHLGNDDANIFIVFYEPFVSSLKFNVFLPLNRISYQFFLEYTLFFFEKSSTEICHLD